MKTPIIPLWIYWLVVVALVLLPFTWLIFTIIAPDPGLQQP